MARRIYDEDAEEDFYQRVESEAKASNKRKRDFASGQPEDGSENSGERLNEQESDDFMQQSKERASDESEALDSYFSGLNSEDKAPPKGFGQKMRMSMRKRRNKILLGALASMLPVVGSFISLPYQLTHLSSLLQQFHFSINEDVGESRTQRLLRYIKYPDTPENRRLGILGNRVADRIETKLRRLGADVNYSAGGFLESFDVDANNAKLIADLEADGMARVNSAPDVPEGKIRFGLTDLDEGGRFNRRTRVSNTKTLFRKAGYGKLSALHSRVLIKKGGLSFRPMGLLPRGTKDDLAVRVRDWKEKRTERRVNGVETDITVKANDADEAATPEEQAERERVQAEADGDNSTRRSLVTEGGTTQERISAARRKLIGGGIAAVGGVSLLCTIRELDEQADELKWANRALPKARIAMDLVAAGEQIKQGEGFTAEEVGVWTEEVQEVAEFVAVESDGTEVVHELGPAVNAEGIRAELGLPGGAPQQESARYSSDRGDLLAKISNSMNGFPAIDTICGVATNPWFGAALTVATLGTYTLLDAGLDAAVLVAGALWIDDLVRIAAGAEVDPEAVGADLGNHANDGSRLNANGQAIAYGGRELTNTETIAWEKRRDENIAYENSQKPFFERYFSFDNPRSLASLATLRMPQGYMASITDIFTSPFAAFAGLIAPAHAQEVSYDYGFPRFGFSIGELEDPRYANPYENIEWLENNADIDELNETLGRDCFDLEINESDTAPEDGTFATLEGTHYYGEDGLIDRCFEARSEVSNEVFTRYRFYVLDNMLLTSLACYEGWEKYCDELGFSNNTTTTAGSNVSGNIVGDPYESSVDVACDPRTDDVGIHDAYVQGNLVPMRLCAIPNLPSSAGESSSSSEFYIDGANGHAIVNSRVSGAWFALAESASLDGVQLAASSSFRSMAKQQALWIEYGMNPTRVATPGRSPHQAGAAIDFQMGGDNTYVPTATCSAPATSPDASYTWLRQNASEFGFGQYAREAWHWDPVEGTYRCFYINGEI